MLRTGNFRGSTFHLSCSTFCVPHPESRKRDADGKEAFFKKKKKREKEKKTPEKLAIEKFYTHL